MEYSLLLENSLAREGSQYLLVDSCGSAGFDIELCESTKHGTTKFRGKFQEADAVNKNKRSYPWDVLNENVERLKECISERGLIGELDHPTDSIIHFANASHIVTKLWWEGNVLMGEGEILNTPSGQIIKNLIDQGVKVGVSSRGVGNGKVNEDGILVIGESFKLITFDVVADPSTYSAFQKKVTTKESNITVSNDYSINRNQVNADTQKNNNNVVKNENVSIDKVNTEVFKALVSGLIKSETQKTKSRLG